MNKVKELCVRRDIKQKELASAVGVSQPTVSDWFNNKTDPSGKRLEKLAEVLCVSHAVILGYDDDPIAPPAMVIDVSGSMAKGKKETQSVIEGILNKLTQLNDNERAMAESHIDFLLERKKKEGKT